MSLLTSSKALRSLRKTPLTLEAVLRDVSQEQAMNAWDGDWNVVYMMCHLNDYEGIFSERHDLLMTQDAPHFPAANHLELVQAHDYAHAHLREAFESYRARRQAYIARLESLTDEQWARRGFTAEGSEATVLTVAINAALHDIDHTEQIGRALGR